LEWRRGFEALETLKALRGEEWGGGSPGTDCGVWGSVVSSPRESGAEP